MIALAGPSAVAAAAAVRQDGPRAAGVPPGGGRHFPVLLDPALGAGPDGLLSPALTAPSAVTGLPLLDAILGNDGPAFPVRSAAPGAAGHRARRRERPSRAAPARAPARGGGRRPGHAIPRRVGGQPVDGGREHVPAGAAEHRDDARRGVRLPARRSRDHGGPLRPRRDGAVRHRRGELLRRGGHAQLPDGGRGPLAHRLPGRRHHQHDSRPAPRPGVQTEGA